MKTFSTLLLTLTLIASSAYAALDSDNAETLKISQPKNPSEIEQEADDVEQARLSAIKQLPTAPSDIQEQLLWGILNLNPEVTEQALKAGATLHEPVRPYGLLFFAFDQADKDDSNFSDNLIRRAYDNEPIALEEIIRFARIARNIHDMVAVLIINGVSVDEDLGMYVRSIRELVNPENEERYFFHEDEQPESVKETYAYAKMMRHHLHMLIEKHQPKP